MASNTPNLGLLKKDPAADGLDTFNIKTMLNDNWDLIDQAVAAKETSEGSQAKADAVQANLTTHIADTIKHITPAERTAFNAKANQSELTAHIAENAPHGAVSTATANKIIVRDANGRAKVAVPSAADDIARKDTVDAHGNLATTAHGGIVPTSLLTTPGDIPYATGPSIWARLAKGTAGQVLKMNAGATSPEWVTDPKAWDLIADYEVSTGGLWKVDFQGLGLENYPIIKLLLTLSSSASSTIDNLNIRLNDIATPDVYYDRSVFMEGSATTFSCAKSSGPSFSLRRVIGSTNNGWTAGVIEVMLSNVYSSHKTLQATYVQSNDLYLHGGYLNPSQNMSITKISVLEGGSVAFDVGSKMVLMGRRKL